MTIKEYKELMKEELEFYKRNPEFPFAMAVVVIFLVLVATGILK